MSTPNNTTSVNTNIQNDGTKETKGNLSLLMQKYKEEAKLLREQQKEERKKLREHHKSQTKALKQSYKNRDTLSKTAKLYKESISQKIFRVTNLSLIRTNTIEKFLVKNRSTISDTIVLGYKYDFLLQILCNKIKIVDGKEVAETEKFHPRLRINIPILHQSDKENILNSLVERFLQKYSELPFEGSGWSLKEIHFLDVYQFVYDPTKAIVKDLES